MIRSQPEHPTIVESRYVALCVRYECGWESASGP